MYYGRSGIAKACCIYDDESCTDLLRPQGLLMGGWDVETHTESRIGILTYSEYVFTRFKVFSYIGWLWNCEIVILRTGIKN